MTTRPLHVIVRHLLAKQSGNNCIYQKAAHRSRHGSGTWLLGNKKHWNHWAKHLFDSLAKENNKTIEESAAATEHSRTPHATCRGVSSPQKHFGNVHINNMCVRNTQHLKCATSHTKHVTHNIIVLVLQQVMSWHLRMVWSRNHAKWRARPRDFWTKKWSICLLSRDVHLIMWFVFFCFANVKWVGVHEPCISVAFGSPHPADRGVHERKISVACERLEGRISIVWEAIDCETHICVVAVVITRHRRQMAPSLKVRFRSSPVSWRSWTQSALAFGKTRASKRHTCHEKILFTAVLRVCAS